jgi:hypothetical protein
MPSSISVHPVIALRQARSDTVSRFSKVSRRYNFPQGVKFFKKKKSPYLPWFRRKKLNWFRRKKVGKPISRS